MVRWLLLFTGLVLMLAGCAVKAPSPVLVTIPTHRVDYLREVKPILDKRCVVCHSCYNSPCQLKLSSYEGLDRGATKKAIYNGARLRTMEPSRLFVDAQTTEQWRQREFFSVTENSAGQAGQDGQSSDLQGTDQPASGYNNSLMLQLLSHKISNPRSRGDYFPEAGDLTCARDGSELGSYLQKHPNRGMPFGFPPLKQEEYNLIAGWLAQGSHGPTPEEQSLLTRVEPQDRQLVERWQTFFNGSDPKQVMTARYLYEHLFLAHITFRTGSGAFYELVRSRTPAGEPIQVIPTVRPYDDPGPDPFFYRFRRVHSTIVHKTHMVFPMDQEQFARISQLFIEPPWLQQPRVMGYEPKLSANPFLLFEQIPARARYQFLLDNANYIIMTFIRGPVCKGQVALNVIHDQFWVMFLDPEHDLTVRHPGFLRLHGSDLAMPIEAGSGNHLFRALLNRHSQAARRFYQARQDFYSSYHYQGQGLETIWAGGRSQDAPLLTVFRHFDSASVHKGVLGELPRTAWLIDFPLLERIYYSLVAGFDVYGTAGHQLAVRLYMDRLRIEGESYFLDFLPQELREPTMRQWYHGIDFKEVGYYPTQAPAAIEFSSSEPKRELLERLVREHIPAELGITFDHNYRLADQEHPPLPEQYRQLEDYIQGFSAVAAPGTAFFRYVQAEQANLAHIRIRIPDQEDAVVSMVINRWHDNVTYLFSEKNTLDPARDKADFIPGFVGSYPNYYFDLGVEELPAFFELLAGFESSPEQLALLDSFGVNRANEGFWEVYDWFQERFNRDQPQTAGLFDLNRYFYKAR
ncbi:fatty acid cis/trans isomerase [Desulfogranum mediterraneum]|uniref:fatty acid cis/trans isomerase n=1 Tax=Desulfogranum mediterraneum TaxID=160661 RepID=UPI00041CF39E|nr:fatty acid cis/trans isomerase [Desulfogranum mediterraneum]